jgi:molecular chaperone DnaJ
VTKRDYYEILEINRDADEAAIKKAYRSLAMKYHPDKNPEDAQAVERMKEINEAYAVLSDKKKRRLYDTYGHAGLEGFTQEDIFRGVDFGSIFEEMFGRGFGFGNGIFDGFMGRGSSGGARRPQRGSDLRYDLEVTLWDVMDGVDKTINIPRIENCSACNGMGAAESDLETCDTCQGSGQMVHEQRSGFSIFRQITTCGKCKGKGKVIKVPCQECKGIGAIEQTKEIKIHIPKGADTGYRILVRGEGEQGNNGAASGDLYVVLRVQRHPVFEREGDDVYIIKEVSFPEATLGSVLNDVPGLEGSLELELPEGTQNGDVLRISKKGLPHLNNNGRGDEYVIVKVVTPTDLSDEEKGLLREFDRLRRKHNSD